MALLLSLGRDWDLGAGPCNPLTPHLCIDWSVWSERPTHVSITSARRGEGGLCTGYGCFSKGWWVDAGWGSGPLPGGGGAPSLRFNSSVHDQMAVGADSGATLLRSAR